MNIEYKVIKDKVVVKDENGNSRLAQNCDNIEKILIQENIIEYLNEELKKCLENHDMDKEITIDEFVPFWGSLFTLMSHFEVKYLLWTMRSLVKEIEPNLYSNFLKPFLYSVAIFLPCLVGLAMDYNNYNDIKDKKGTKAKLEYIKKQLEQEKGHLSKLQNGITNIKKKSSKNTTFKKINYENILEEFKEEIDLYYELGFKEKKLYKQFLNNKLDNYYSGDNLKLVKEYFNNKDKIR